MKILTSFALTAFLTIALNSAARAEEDAYVPGPDSKPQVGVPQGELIKFEFQASHVFPGTARQVTVYVPHQYDGSKPACLYVDQDGVQWNAPTVLDNLIARGELPVMIGVFITPGIVPAHNPAAELPRFNRSYEYDGLGDGYYHLLVDEVLPAVESKRTAAGLPILLSHEANDRAIAGSSSGAIAAFNVAWEHPDSFSRVISSVGTYVGLRGGDRFPTLVRKYEPKRLRVFLQDGSHDLNIYAGDWWMANQTMERALTFAGYEVNHNWGDGSHNGKHISSILPDALRWVWKDWPKPVAAGHSENGALEALLVDGEGWTPGTSGAVVAAGTSVTAHNGNTYLVEGHEVWLRPKDRERRLADALAGSATAVTLSPDQSLLYVADGDSHWIYSYQLAADGTPTDKQRYYWLHTDDLDDESHATAMCCDRSGWLYVATGLGIQICDQAGRVNAILPTPGGQPDHVSFSGPGMNLLRVSCGGSTYDRKLNTVGVDPADVPVMPPAPHL
jgi:enterochelin esterase-like enzyme